MRQVLWFLGCVFLFGTTCAAEQGRRDPLTREERERIVMIARMNETSPLDAKARKDKEWAVLRLIEAPDITVKLCTAVLGKNFGKDDFPYASEMVTQLLLSSAAFIIGNPDAARDDKAQYLAGVEGVLNAYQSVLRDKPRAASKALDDLLRKQKDGTLVEFIRDVSRDCR